MQMMPQLFLRIRSRGPHLARDAASDATSAAANNGSPFWLMLAMQQAMLQVMQLAWFIVPSQIRVG